MKKLLKTIFMYLPVLGIVIGMSQITKVQKYLSFATQAPANLVVDVNQSAGVPSRPWVYLAQGGESSSFNLEPFEKAISDLKPRYLRIDHLYDFYIQVTKNPDGSLAYDYSKLDALIHEMQQLEILPFISLSYTPAILNSDITGIPSDWSEYRQIIQKTIEHLSGKSALNLPDVYYEVWNEPDLFGNWKTYGNKNYLQLYSHAAHAAAAASNVRPFKFGGPATTRLYPNWVRAFMALIKDQNLKLDFISWHHYTSDPADYRADIQLLKKLMVDYPEYANRIEVIISEWGPNSENDPVYDNPVSASHLVASLFEMIPVVDKAFIFELEDGKNPQNEEYWGRWGLYTHRDYGTHIKPRAEAIKLLNQLGEDRLLVSGTNVFIKALSARKNQTIQLAVANYDKANKHTETVPVTINGLTPGLYKQTKTFLSRSTYSQVIEITSETYQTSIPLAPNVVVLLELTPQ